MSEQQTNCDICNYDYHCDGTIEDCDCSCANKIIEEASINCEHRYYKVTETRIREVVVNFRLKNKNHEKTKLVSLKATKTCLDCTEVIYENQELTNK